MAFFPCIYFETVQQLFFCLQARNHDNYTMQYRIQYAIDRLEKRTEYHKILYQLLYVCIDKGLRMILENPAASPNYLITGQNFPAPTLIDKHRRYRGDYFDKPTAYWFINCEPTKLETFTKPRQLKTVLSGKPSDRAGMCSEERSLISPDYARNFICDFIVGREQHGSQLSLF